MVWRRRLRCRRAKCNSRKAAVESSFLGAGYNQNCREHVFSYVDLGSALSFLACNTASRDKLLRATSCIKVSVSKGYADLGLTGPVGPFCLGNCFCECREKQHGQPFYSQCWSPTEIKARICIDSTVFASACAQLFEGDASRLLSSISEALGPVMLLAQRLEVTRMSSMHLPLASIERIPDALKLLPQPREGLSIGLAPYESKDFAHDWEGTAYAFYPAVMCSSLRLEPGVEAFLDSHKAQYAIDEHEVTNGFVVDAGVSNERILKALPGLRAFFERDLHVTSLSQFSEVSRCRLQKLGCVRVGSVFDFTRYVPGSARQLPTDIPVFAQIEFVSLHIQDFACGSSAWTSHVGVRDVDRTQGAISLVSFLAKAFPRVTCAQVLFSFDDPLLEMPRGDYDVLEMVEFFLARWQTHASSNAGQEFNVRYALKLWGTYFDSLDHVRQVLAHRARYKIFFSHLNEELIGVAKRRHVVQIVRQTPQESTDVIHALDRQVELDKRKLRGIFRGLSLLVGPQRAARLVAQVIH